MIALSSWSSSFKICIKEITQLQPKNANVSQGKTFQNNLNKNVLNIVSNPKAIETNKTNNWGILNCLWKIKIKVEIKVKPKMMQTILLNV